MQAYITDPFFFLNDPSFNFMYCQENLLNT